MSFVNISYILFRLLLPKYSNEGYLRLSTRFNVHINATVSHGCVAILCMR